MKKKYHLYVIFFFVCLLINIILPSANAQISEYKTEETYIFDFPDPAMEKAQIQSDISDSYHYSSPTKQFSKPIWMIGLILNTPDKLPNNVVVSIQSSIDGVNWSNWSQMDNDYQKSDSFYYFDPIALDNKSSYVKYDIDTEDKVNINYVKIVGLDPTSDQNDTASVQKAPSKQLSVIMRSDWGADESIMFWDDDMEFKSIKQIIIHHTAGNDNSPLDPPAIVRGIYQFHTVDRGWGDIGYNYLIDQHGNIYEGRKGGLGSVGAHALGFNYGSVGISVIGDFTKEKPASPSQESLSYLLSEISRQTNLDLSLKVVINDQIYPVVVGHRDVNDTECPGDKFYSILSGIVNNVDNIIPKKSIYQASIFELPSPDQYMYAEEDLTLSVKYLNNGSLPWLQYQNDVQLVAVEPYPRQSGFYSDSWIDSSRLGGPLKYTIMTDQVGDFVFKLHADVSPGTYTEKFALSTPNGILSTTEFVLNITVLDPDIKNNTPITQFDYLPVKSENDFVFIQNQPAEIRIDLQNIGQDTWYRVGDYPLHLGTSNPNDHDSILYTSKDHWLTQNRVALLQDEVKPGDVGSFLFNINTSHSPGTYIESFLPVVENLTWIEKNPINIKISIEPAINQASLVYTSTRNINLKPGQTVRLWVQLQNTGNTVWNNIQIVTNKPILRSSEFYNYNFWQDKNIVSDSILTAIKPGKSGWFELLLTAPTKPGIYVENFVPQIGDHVLDDANIVWNITVKS